MCGGFACALGRDPRGRGATAVRHLLYNSGRLTTYCFLGALAGALGQVICTRQGTTFTAARRLAGRRRAILAIVAGLLMIAMALQFFGLLQAFHRLTVGFGSSTFALSLRSLLTTRNRAAPLAFGVFNGFLPCPLVYAFAAEAASTFQALPGSLTMASFGLGTFPAMLMMGGVGRVIAPAWRQRGVWLAGSLYPAPRHDHARPWIAAIGRAHVAQPVGRAPRMTASGGSLCRHCLLPVGRRALAANCQRRKLRVLLLRLLDRFPGEERQDRRMGSGMASDPARRRRLSVHEHHAVQPAHLWRGLYRRRCQAASIHRHSAPDSGDPGGDNPRRSLFARDFA